MSSIELDILDINIIDISMFSSEPLLLNTEENMSMLLSLDDDIPQQQGD